MAAREGRLARGLFISAIAVATWWGCAQVAGPSQAPLTKVELTAAEASAATTLPADETPAPGPQQTPPAGADPSSAPASPVEQTTAPASLLASAAGGQPAEAVAAGSQASPTVSPSAVPAASTPATPPASAAGTPAAATPAPAAASAPATSAPGAPSGMPPLPPLPPGLGATTLTPLAGPGRAEGGEKGILWLEADEYGQLALTDTHYVLFYPLRYHGGFNVDVTRGPNMESIQKVAVAPVVPDKDIQLIAELKNVLGVEATHYSSLNLLVIKIPVEKRKEFVRQVKDLLDVLDAPRKQVSIEGKIVEITRDAETQLGVDWTVTNSTNDFFRSGRGNLNIPGSPRFGTNDFNVGFDNGPAGANVRLNATLRALEAASKLNVISEPNMVVEVGQTARILVGERVPVMTKWTGVVGTEQVTTELEPIGVRLFVTPLVVSEDTIRMHVAPQVSVVKEFRVTSTGIENPIVETRDAETVVSVQDGEFIKIGGLLFHSKIKNEVKVPLLGDVPFLGFLFKSWRYQDKNQDLIIYITPRIVRGPLIQPGAGVPFMGAAY